MITKFDFEEGVLWIKNTDGLQHEEYPLEKRFELHKAHPSFCDEMFGGKFDDFIEWILSKRNNSDYDKKFCESVDKLVKKYEKKK
jgi:hypothetical protein